MHLHGALGEWVLHAGAPGSAPLDFIQLSILSICLWPGLSDCTPVLGTAGLLCGQTGLLVTKPLNNNT